MFSFYLAARFSRRFELQGYRAELRRAGIEVTSRWIDTDCGDENEASAARDLQDVEIADGLILFTDDPRCATRGGKHHEAGYAQALGKKLIGVGRPGNIFHLMPEWTFYDDWSDAFDALTKPRVSLREIWSPRTLRV